MKLILHTLCRALFDGTIKSRLVDSIIGYNAIKVTLSCYPLSMGFHQLICSFTLSLNKNCCLLNFSSALIFKVLYSPPKFVKMLSECQTTWIWVRHRVTRHLTRIQAFCKWEFSCLTISTQLYKAFSLVDGLILANQV